MRLQSEEASILAISSEQQIVGSLLNEFALFQHQDAIGNAG